MQCKRCDIQISELYWIEEVDGNLCYPCYRQLVREEDLRHENGHFDFDSSYDERMRCN
jgi:hypothetical protein